jgi:xanthine dehydrogenase YagS FAD-binding subunit
MNSFAIATPTSHEQAAALLKDKRFKLPILKGGGMDVVDHLKEGLWDPDLLINIKRVRAQGKADAISMDGGKIRIESSTTMADIVASKIINENAPALAQALEGAATPQVRNVATAAGNLLQRPRCWYYRNEQFDCLKKGGSRCYAADGENQYHAIFGDGPCHIVHPSNLAPALHVCQGAVHLTGGTRSSLNISELYHMPDKGIRTEHNLEPTEVVTHITLTPAPKSGFYAVKEKQSFDWPLAFACVALEMDAGKIGSARVCAGAVAPIPWPLPKVEAALKGVSAGDDDAIRKACALATEGAKPMTQNAYKLRLLPVVIHRAIVRAAGRQLEVLA